MMSTCSRDAALFYPHRSVLMQTGIGLFRGKISKNRLVCKNAVANTGFLWEVQAPSNVLLVMQLEASAALKCCRDSFALWSFEIFTLCPELRAYFSK